MRRLVLVIGFGVYSVVFFLVLASFQYVPVEESWVGDADAYYHTALHLVQDHRYSMDGIHLFADREPGYSFFIAPALALFGSLSVSSIFFLQGAVYAIAVFLFCRELLHWYPRRTVEIAFFVLLLSSGIIRSIFSILRENFTLTLFLFFVTALFSLLRRPNMFMAIAAGACLSVIIITYFPFVYFPILLVGFLVYKKLSWRFIGTLLLVGSLLPIGWGLRNMAMDGRFRIIDANRMTQMWYVRGEQAQYLRGLEPLFCLQAEYITRDWSNRSHACSYNNLMHRVMEEMATNHTPAMDALIAAQSQEKIRRYFPFYLWESLFNALELHFPHVGGGWSHLYNILAMLGTAFLGLGCIMAIRDFFRPQNFFFALCILYNTLVYSLTGVAPRYLLPMFFCYAVFCAIGITNFLSFLKRT